MQDTACSAGDLSSVAGLGRSPGEGNGDPLQCSCLESPIDRGAWRLQSLGSQRVGHDLVAAPPPPHIRRHGVAQSRSLLQKSPALPTFIPFSPGTRDSQWSAHHLHGFASSGMSFPWNRPVPGSLSLREPFLLSLVFALACWQSLLSPPSCWWILLTAQVNNLPGLPSNTVLPATIAGRPASPSRRSACPHFLSSLQGEHQATLPGLGGAFCPHHVP